MIVRFSQFGATRLTARTQVQVQVAATLVSLKLGYDSRTRHPCCRTRRGWAGPAPPCRRRPRWPPPVHGLWAMAPTAVEQGFERGDVLSLSVSIVGAPAQEVFDLLRRYDNVDPPCPDSP